MFTLSTMESPTVTCAIPVPVELTTNCPPAFASNAVRDVHDAPVSVLQKMTPFAISETYIVVPSDEIATPAHMEGMLPPSPDPVFNDHDAPESVLVST